MKENKNIIIIFLIILLSTILIGNPLTKNDNLINIVIGISGIYTIIKSKKEKQEIITSKTTKAMLILLVISALPLISNTYITLTGTVNYIFRYISIFIIYIIINKELKENRESLGKIKDIIIISGVILVIFGIDLLTTNITYDFVKAVIGVTTDQESLTRMYSLFLYSNTFAISTAVAYIISIEQVLNKKGKIYSGISTLLLSGIILSQSRTTILILALIIVMYLLIISKEEKYVLLKLIITNIVCGLIYATAFTYLKRTGYINCIWLITFMISIISSLIYNKIGSNGKIDKIFKIRYLIMIFVTSIIIVFILSMFKSELILFNNYNSQTKITKNIYDVKENNQYKIELEIEAKSDTLKDNYTIEFIQRNNYSDNLGEEKIEVNNYSGIKEFDINAVEGIKWIEFSVSAKETGNGKELKIKSLKVNGKDFTLNYKFLPTDIIAQLKYINLSQRSIQERKIFIIDGLKILKKYVFWGIGGDGYKYAVQDVQTYYYGVSQMHCYILQIAIEFGILGLFVFGYLIILTVKNIISIIKNREKEKNGIVFAFIALFLHSFVDFDMTFFYSMIIFYALMAIINFNENNYTKLRFNNIIEIIILIAVSICTIFNTSELYVKSTKDNTLKKTRTYEQKTKIEKEYMYLVPYSIKYKIDRIEYIKLYGEVKEKELSEEEKENMRKELVQLLKTSIIFEKNNSSIIGECIQIIENSNCDMDREMAYRKIEEMLRKHRYNASQILSDYINLKKLNDMKLQDIIDRNIENSIEKLQDYNRCRITKQQSEEMIKKIKSEEGMEGEF